ncbi:hypothetical protein MLD38_008055 [Melastoma candidum]|uniref:Uncharacterized protein n=1 Tax=Melastoma candidum TaxID=119954 RepID=A0ACB9RUZ9_9MYRT|nr:hypothetical protein MLD38_008055 [Melastoma candidum]
MEPVGNLQDDSFPTSYGLLRFRSAPSSLHLSNTADAPHATKDDIESGGFGQGFLNYGGGHDRDDISEPESRSLQIFTHNPQSTPSVMTTTMTTTTEVGYRDLSHHSLGLPPQYPRYSRSSSFSGIEGGNSGLLSSGGMNNNRIKAFAPGLTRQSSSPPGLFSDITASNGYTILNGPGNYQVDRDMDRESSPPASMLKNQNSFPSGPPSLGMLPWISELRREDLRAHSPNDTKSGLAKLDDRLEGHGFLFDPWNEPASRFSQNFMSLKKDMGNGLKESLESQNGEVGGRHVSSLLSPYLSSSKSSSGMVALHFRDSVPCKIRAKRGCATHPRSIAERVRRTRISERMRKLQELVPNMDKTNTADMLDLAVEYIKNLQKQYKILSEYRANCKCMTTW